MKRLILLSVVMGLCLGVSCTISGPDDNDNGGLQGNDNHDATPGRTTLDQANATLTIVQEAGGSEADVTAELTDENGVTLELQGEQAVLVNGQALDGPDSDDVYTATIEADSEYVIAVREPTRGVEETTVDAPGDFEVTSPVEGGGAPLSGFTLEWSNPNNLLTVRIKISQTLFGETESVTFGPFTDTGSREFDVADLEPFRQGADLVITVTKINARASVSGFDTATVQSRVYVVRRAEPRS
jgi:hypothetical protein